MAGALSVIVWRMLRDEKQRSEARIAALAVLAARPASSSSSSPRLQSASPALAMPLKPAPAPPVKASPVVASGSATALFEEHVEESPWKNRFAVMTALGLVLASIILFALAANTSKAPAHAAAGGAATKNAAAVPAAGLELISLRDSRQAESLTITGLVRNPGQGAPLDRVTVTAYTFDDKGSFLASGRALIDVTALAPGDESPFVVSVPVSETVARYRIGFRGEDGRVIAHVDKRQQGPIAANW